MAARKGVDSRFADLFIEFDLIDRPRQDRLERFRENYRRHESPGRHEADLRSLSQPGDQQYDGDEHDDGAHVD